MPQIVDEQKLDLTKKQIVDAEVTNTLSNTSYDADTPTVLVDGEREDVRIKGVGGTEIDKKVSGFGKNILRVAGVRLPNEGSGQAEFFKKGINGIFGKLETGVDRDGVDMFNRTLGNLDVEGIDYRHLMYELGVSNRWTNYGYDELGSDTDNNLKWYGGKSQATNIDAYRLLKRAPDPTTILDDKTFGRINDLRASLMTHMGDANEGVVDKEEAVAVAKELMHNPSILAKAQERRWYEETRTSDIAKMMLADWNVPIIRSEIESQSRVVGRDVSPRVDTSWSGILLNAVHQQIGDTARQGVGERAGSHKDGTFTEEFDNSAVDAYIAENSVSPDVAVKMYKALETSGSLAAINVGDYERTDIETKATDEKIMRSEGIAKSLVFAAAPYLDPTSLIGGGVGGVVAKKVIGMAYAKATSPLIHKLITRTQSTAIGASVGLGESVGYTSSNYKDFTNDQLLTTWATDAAFGGAFSAVFAIGARGVKGYGASQKAKIAGEGIEDLKITEPLSLQRTEENAAFSTREEEIKAFEAEEIRLQAIDDDAYKSFVKSSDEIQNRMIDMQDEVTLQVQTGKTPEIITPINVSDAPVLPEPIDLRGAPQVGDTEVSNIMLDKLKPVSIVEYLATFKSADLQLDKNFVEILKKQGDDGKAIRNKSIAARATRLKNRTERHNLLVSNHAKLQALETERLTNPDAVDTRTPEEIDLADEVWLDAQMEVTLQHQGEVVRPEIERVNASQNVVARAMKAAGKGLGLQEFTSKLLTHADNKMSFIGSRILETGTGFGGKLKRNHSAALVKDSIYTRSVGNLNEQYVTNISAWAMRQGSGTYKAFKAAWEGGKVNDVARQFHKAAFLRQEMKQMGKQVEPDDYLDNYLKQLNKTNDELFEGRISAGIKGFDANRRIKNYIPHVWKKVKVAEIIKRHGEQVVVDLLEKSIEASKRSGKMTDNVPTKELAQRQLNWINGLGDSLEHVDEVGAGISGRGKSRIPLDFTVEHNGLSMLDLIDTDLPSVMDSYIQRAAADIGISKATGGLIRSEGDFVKYLTPDSDADKLLAQDAMDLLYGKPTRQGMSPEMRSLMDLVTVQQMGGIGVAQMAETGTMAQRLVVNYMSQPVIARKIWKMAGEKMDDKGVLHQIRSISAVNDNMQYINRYSVNNIDQAQIDELSDLRAASIDAVDKVTFGAYKAQFGRMLGSLSGVNAVQKAQSRLLQASFSVDIARGFKFGKGTSTAKRLNDLGLADDGGVAKSMRELVEFDADGFPTNFNFEKWDKSALDDFVHSMNREEAQLMPRVMAGELPVFMNKPIWQAIMQFRKTPLAFMSKGTQRNLQFADREAILGTVLNSMTAGITRYAKVAAAGGAYVALSGDEFEQPTMDQMQPYNYVSNFGILGDSYSLGQSWSKAYQQKDGIESLWEGAKTVPVLSGMDNAYHALEGDPTAIKKAMPLNTLPLINEVANAVIKHMEQ